MQNLKVDYPFEKVSDTEQLKYNDFNCDQVGEDYVFTVIGLYKYDDIQIPFNIEMKKVPVLEYELDMFRSYYFANRAILTERILDILRKKHSVVAEAKPVIQPEIKPEVKAEQEVRKTVLLKSNLLDETKAALLEETLTVGKKSTKVVKK